MDQLGRAVAVGRGTGVPLCHIGFQPPLLLLVGQRGLHCYVTIDYPHIRWGCCAGRKRKTVDKLVIKEATELLMSQCNFDKKSFLSLEKIFFLLNL